MKTVAIIQARMGSSRFPGKVLTPLGGQPVLGWVVRAARAISGVDVVAVATSDRSADDAIAVWCAGQHIACHRGSETDVLERFAQAARAEDGEVFVRLTADCPLLDPAVCAMVVALRKTTGADYACNFDPRSWPDGLDCEAFSADALEKTVANAQTSFEREHVTPFMRADRKLFHVAQLTCPIPGQADHRWTLDTRADLAFMEAVVARLPADERPPSWLEILAAADGVSHPGAVPASETQATASVNDIHHRGYGESRALLERACKVIPLGSQTFSKSHIQYPREAPMFLTKGDGARVWDVDGNEFVDLVSGLLPVVLGYRDPDVDAAIRRQLDSGISFSLATQLETELAERLVDLIPCAEMVRFGKNGTDATSAAVRLARAFTGRDRVAVSGYHGWQDWYIGTTARNNGVPVAVSALTHTFAFNNAAALDALLAAHPGEFACVVMEPVGAVEPDVDYLNEAKAIAHRHGALLVFDEIITGFRVALGGAQAHYGVTPDLACFGKAMGNGMPISAVVGRVDVLREMENVFFSGTFGGEALSLAASIAVIDKMRTTPVIERLWETGQRLSDGAGTRIKEHGLHETIGFTGLAPWRVLTFRDHPKASKEALRTVFIAEMLKAGVLINASHNVTYALSSDDEERVLAAYDTTLARLAGELQAGSLDARLGDDIIRPIFQVRNSG